MTFRPCQSSIMAALAILFIGSIVFLVIGIKDFAWTYYLWRHPWPTFMQLMSRSLYEGDWPGASDIGTSLSIVAFLIWLKVRSDRKKEVLTQGLRFVFTTGAVGWLITIQMFKWLVSRARPRTFESEVLSSLYTGHVNIWLPGFMGWRGPRGYGWNSFPSGHVGTCAVLLSLVYLIPRQKRLVRYGAASAVTVLTLAMAIARSMAGMHWLSDSVASFFMVWALIHYASERMRIKDGLASQSFY